ncbi:sensor histidine kinase [Algoriphagus yeomjeoni]|uniref:Two component regulator with propeller domain n=1 Tax=Algoriphagus yeomjeoni TaxID=291403 RepID=A0A327P2K8_9BACT|nr:histidine kinase [Algoriphagus yeomjeoni]RAI84186.1 two component regulator with propeller domain [Algoriphagus yeomjeoni]
MGFIKILFLFFLTALVFSFSVEAQQIPSFNFTTADGLPNNSIRSLLIDSRGILWIGTENGVSKLENGVFQNFYESDGLGFNSCWAIAEDKKGNVWFGSYGGGISVFDGQKFHVFTTADGLADNRIRHFYPYQNKMLIGTEDGVSIADLETFEISSILSSIEKSELNYTAGFFEVDDRLFYSTYRSGSYEIVWENEVPQTIKINDWLPIYSVSVENDSLLLADKGSVKKISSVDFILGKAPSHSFGQSIFWKSVEGLKGEKYLLAASTFSKDGGVFLLKDGQMAPQNEWFGVTSNFILSGALDQKRELLYLGSHDKGLFQIRLDEVIFYEELDGAEVKGIAGEESNLGILSNQGLEIRDSLEGTNQVELGDFKKVQAAYFRDFPSKIPKHMDGFFELDPSISAKDIEFYELHFEGNSFWTNTNIGIFQLDLKGVFLAYLPVHAFSIGFTPDGKLLETNPYAGVRIYSDPKNFVFTYFEPTDSSTPLQISKVVKGKTRNYLASVFHGLYHWDGENFFSYKNEGIWDESKFKTLHYLKDGVLLAGTEFGDLYQVKIKPNFEILKKWPKEELEGESILFIESYQETILVVAELGLHILKDGENRFWSEGNKSFKRVFKSAAKIADQLYLGLDKGFYIINLPKLLAQEYPPLGLVVTELKVNNKPVNADNFNWFAYQGEKLLLTSKENSLSIRFKPTGKLNEAKLRYHYRIKPDAEWTAFSEEPLVELPYLPSGNYQLEVEVLDYFSGKLTQISLLEFSIAKPFYLRAWFIISMICLLAAMVFVLYRTRLNRIRSQSQLKQRLTEIKLEALQSQMNPHFTFNAINSIQYFILKNDTTQALAFLGKFSKLIRITLEQSSKSQVSLEEEISYLSQYIEVENSRMDHRMKWEINGDALERQKEIMIPPMLIQPLVENVFVHAFPAEHPNPELMISYEIISSTQLRCIVQDNGVGMHQESQNRHDSKGLKMIREKLSLLPGYRENSFEIRSDARGYTVRVVIFYGEN